MLINIIGGKEKMEQVFIISPLVGSVIGYFTNWLAIKMLFRPLTEKKIFGIKIPLTPGVIPRRRSKLAESIGSTVGSKLLTPDAFRQLLQGPEIQTKVKEFIRSQLKKLESEERSLKEILKEILAEQDQRQDLKAETKKLIEQAIENLLAESNLIKLLDKLFAQLDQESLEDYFTSASYQQFRDKLLAKLNSETGKKLVIRGLKLARAKAEASDHTLEEILPKPLIKKLKDWIERQEPKLVDQLEEVLQSPAMKDRLNQKVEEFLGNTPLLGMLGAFKSSLIDKFINLLIDFLQEEENRAEIRRQLDKFVDSLLATPLEELAKEVADEDIEQIAQVIVDYLTEARLQSLVGVLEQELADQLGDSDKSGQLVDKLTAQLSAQSQFLTAQASGIIYSGVETLVHQPIANYFTEVSEDRLSRLETGLVNVIEYILEHQFGDVLANLDFEQMVIDKVNSFDVVEVEGLLLDVIETELNAITWFGAGLGFVMGLITPVISLISG